MNVGGHVVPKKLSDSLLLQIQHLSHPRSVFVLASPTHCLAHTRHTLPTPLHLFLLQTLVVLVWCFVFFILVIPSLIPLLSVL